MKSNYYLFNEFNGEVNQSILVKFNKILIYVYGVQLG